MTDEKAKVTDNTHEMTFSDLFTRPNSVTIPLFQREYVWTQKQWRRMQREIELIAEGNDASRFLGALIAIKRDSGNPATPDHFEIVDGQQRLTTLFLFILAAALVAARNKEDEYASGIINQMLILNWVKNAVNTKLIPSFADRAQFNDCFNQVISLGNLTAQFSPIVNLPENSGETSGKLKKQFARIRAYLSKVYSNDGEKRFKLLVESARNRLTFVYILLRDASNATTVFEGLNDPGIPIGIGDLIRNEVFSKVSQDPQNALNIHRSMWVPFRDKLGEHFDNYFFPFGIVQSPSVKRADLFETLRDHWGPIDNPSEIIEKLEEYADIYLAIVQDDSVLDIPKKVRKAIVDLRGANLPSSTHPFLMRLLKEFLDGNISEANVVGCCGVLESFLVRRAIVGLEPTGLLVFFRTVWANIKDKPSAKSLRASFSSRSTIEWPTNERVKRAIEERPIYQVGIIKFLLSEYDRSLGADVPNDIPWIEHVMPQTLSADWKGKLNPVQKDEHAAIMHTWGNLIPLSSEMNQELSNGLYSKKRKVIKADSMYKSARELAEMNSAWGTKEIRTRSRKIANWAIKRWPFFG